MADYFIRRGDTVRGPFEAETICNMAVASKLRPQDGIRRGDDGDWIPAVEIPGLFDGQESKGELIVDPLVNAAGQAAGMAAGLAKGLFGAASSAVSAASSAAAQKMKDRAERKREQQQADAAEREAVEAAESVARREEEVMAPLVPVAIVPPVFAAALSPAAQRNVERDLLVAHPAMFANSPVNFILCLLLAPVGVGLIILFFWWLSSKGTVLTVTNQRTVLRTGLLSKYTTEVRHRDVRNVQLGQSFLQRILGVGAIGISSSGQAGIEIAVSGIPDPEGIKRLIDRYRETEAPSGPPAGRGT